VKKPVESNFKDVMERIFEVIKEKDLQLTLETDGDYSVVGLYSEDHCYLANYAFYSRGEVIEALKTVLEI